MIIKQIWHFLINTFCGFTHPSNIKCNELKVANKQTTVSRVFYLAAAGVGIWKDCQAGEDIGRSPHCVRPSSIRATVYSFYRRGCRVLALIFFPPFFCIIQQSIIGYNGNCMIIMIDIMNLYRLCWKDGVVVWNICMNEKYFVDITENNLRALTFLSPTYLTLSQWRPRRTKKVNENCQLWFIFYRNSLLPQLALYPWEQQTITITSCSVRINANIFHVLFLSFCFILKGYYSSLIQTFFISPLPL